MSVEAYAGVLMSVGVIASKKVNCSHPDNIHHIFLFHQSLNVEQIILHWSFLESLSLTPQDEKRTVHLFFIYNPSIPWLWKRFGVFEVVVTALWRRCGVCGIFGQRVLESVDVCGGVCGKLSRLLQKLMLFVLKTSWFLSLICVESSRIIAQNPPSIPWILSHKTKQLGGIRIDITIHGIEGISSISTIFANCSKRCLLQESNRVLGSCISLACSNAL